MKSASSAFQSSWEDSDWCHCQSYMGVSAWLVIFLIWMQSTSVWPREWGSVSFVALLFVVWFSFSDFSCCSAGYWFLCFCLIECSALAYHHFIVGTTIPWHPLLATITHYLWCLLCVMGMEEILVWLMHWIVVRMVCSLSTIMKSGILWVTWLLWDSYREVAREPIAIVCDGDKNSPALIADLEVMGV